MLNADIKRKVVEEKLLEKAREVYLSKINSGEIDSKQPIHKLNKEYEDIKKVLGVGR